MTGLPLEGRSVEGPPPRVVRRGKLRDRLDTEEGTAVLVLAPGGHRVIRLSDTGAAVLDALDERGGVADLATLTAALVERLGAPSGVEPETAVRAVVGALMAEYVVEEAVSES